MKYLAIFLLVSSVSAVAEQTTDCARIVDRDARLDCFDKLFPAAQQPQPEPETEPVPEPEPVPPRTAAGPQSAPDESAEAPPVVEEPAVGIRPGVPSNDRARVAEPAPADEPDPVRKGDLFNDPEVDLTASIAAIHRGDKQKMVFLLDNDQVWIQATPRLMSFREGDTVVIRNAKFGGYFMRSSRGTATRVQRIK